MPLRLWQAAGDDGFGGHHAALEGKREQERPGDLASVGTCSGWLPVPFLASQWTGEMVLKVIRSVNYRPAALLPPGRPRVPGAPARSSRWRAASG